MPKREGISVASNEMTIEKLNAAQAYVNSVKGVGEESVSLKVSFVLELIAVARTRLERRPAE